MADTRREQGARVDDEPRLTTVEEMRDAAPGARIIGLSTIWNDETDLAQTGLGKLSDAGVPG